jgi:hypothetical protein
MNDTQLIQQFCELIDKSSMSPERKTYWLSKVADGDFNEADETRLAVELDEQIEKVDAAIQITEAEIAASETKKAAAETRLLPYLRQLAKGLPKYLADATATFKKDILGAEKQMMTDVEKVRGTTSAAEISDIRKKLGL